MAFNGSGVFLRLYNWVNDAAANIKIRADRMDNEMNGFATGLSTCITKDGQTTITADLPMAGYKHTNVGSASAGTDYARADQLLASTYCGTSAGTNTVTATVPIGGSFNAAGKIVSFKAGGTNTGATTFNGVTVQKLGQALEAGDITTGDIVVLEHDGTNAQMVSPARFPVLANYSLKGLVLDKTVFTALTSVSPATGDTIAFGDASDFDAIKRTTVTDVLSLVPTVSGIIASIADAKAGTASKLMDAATFEDVGLVQLQSTVSATSGTTATISSIPSGVKKITLDVITVSPSAPDSLRLRLGDAGGIETTAYDTGSSVFSGTTAFALYTDGFRHRMSTAAAGVCTGRFTLTLHSASTNTWVCEGSANNGVDSSCIVQGYKSLSQELTTLQLDWASGSSFDGSGVISAKWEF